MLLVRPKRSGGSRRTRDAIVISNSSLAVAFAGWPLSAEWFWSGVFMGHFGSSCSDNTKHSQVSNACRGKLETDSKKHDVSRFVKEGNAEATRSSTFSVLSASLRFKTQRRRELLRKLRRKQSPLPQVRRRLVSCVGRISQPGAKLLDFSPCRVLWEFSPTRPGSGTSGKATRLGVALPGLVVIPYPPASRKQQCTQSQK